MRDKPINPTDYVPVARRKQLKQSIIVSLKWIDVDLVNRAVTFPRELNENGFEVLKKINTSTLQCCFFSGGDLNPQTNKFSKLNLIEEYLNDYHTHTRTVTFHRELMESGLKYMYLKKINYSTLQCCFFSGGDLNPPTNKFSKFNILEDYLNNYICTTRIQEPWPSLEN